MNLMTQHEKGLTFDFNFPLLMSKAEESWYQTELDLSFKTRLCFDLGVNLMC